jgi:uncharacterized protein
MIKYAIPLVAASALASTANAAEITLAATGPVVELTITESVKGKPDIATIGAGVTTEAPTAQAAMQQNAQQMNAVIARIKALGIKTDDIQTTGFSLSARYDYDQEAQRQVFAGYQAANRVSVLMRDLGGVGAALDALVASGATDLSGPDFGIENEAAAKSQARKAAMAKARSQALEYAEAAGFGALRLLEVNETIQSFMPMPMSARAEFADAAKSAPTPVEPGMVGTSVTVTVKFEMTN